jgi:multicomponent Na+:H+ antiporter subunit A
MLAVLAVHVAVAAAVVPVGNRFGRWALPVAALAPLAAVVFLLLHAADIVDGRAWEQDVAWIPELDLSLAFRIDGFALLFGLLIAGIGVLVLLYARWYLHGDEDGIGRLAGLLVLFAGAMLGLVTADHLLLLYVCWELTTITSYLLVGWDDRSPAARAAALQALLTTGSCGLAMLGGLVLLGQEAGTYRLSAILADPPSGTVVTVGLLLVLLGALAKSAQYPFHAWLPGAMAAPAPVSAYLHSATMVKAGVYVIARFSPAFATSGPWRWVCIGFGLVTLFGGGLRALRQHDLKLLLAFGTVSQLGLLVLLFGVGTPLAVAAGVLMLLAHALFKAALFMTVGVIDHQNHTRDLRQLTPPRGRRWRPVVVVAVLAATSMAAIPLLFGFIAKEEAYAALYEGGFGGSALVLAGVVLGSMLTVAYSARFLWGAFLPYDGASPDPPPPVPSGPPPRTAFWAPAGLLALLGLVLGVLPGLADPLVGAAIASLSPGKEVQLKLWHGFNVPLLLSAITLAAGLGLFAARRAVSRFQARFAGRFPDGTQGYLAVLRGANVFADRLTGVVQSGSLPAYVGLILVTTTAFPAAVLVSTGAVDELPMLVERPIHVVLAVVMVAGGLAASILKRRFAAALCLGAVGYAMGLLFALQGAPDLALTQFAIETLSVVLFVLVLRFLPDRFDHRPPGVLRAVRGLVATMVGLATFLFALAAGTARVAEPPADALVAASVPEAGGANVVNVILVDFRGADTLGEIAVLLVAAVGAVSLARFSVRAGTRSAERRGGRRVGEPLGPPKAVLTADEVAAVSGGSGG